MNRFSVYVNRQELNWEGYATLEGATLKASEIFHMAALEGTPIDIRVWDDYNDTQVSHLTIGRVL